MQRVLANGLTLIVREDRKAPVVAADLWVRVGSNDEDDSVLGWSHGIEHMMFKGTARRGPGQAAREVREAGGVMNAATGYETTHYFVTLPSGGLDVALDILSDAILHSVFDSGELDRERSVIVEENRMYRDQPSGYGHTWEKLLALAFEVSPYRRPIGGPDESLRSTPRDAILAYRERRYVPGDAALVVVGDVAAAEACALAEAHFGAWRAAPAAPHDAPLEPPQRAPRARAVPSPLAKGYVKMGWHAGPETDRETYAIGLLLRVLARGRSSRIYRELLEARGLLSDVGVVQETGSRESIFALDMVADPERLDAIVPAALAEVDRLRAGGVTPDEAERAKSVAIRAHVLGQETVDAQARALGHAWARGDAALADRAPEIVASIAPEEIRLAAERVFRREACTALVLHPEGAAVSAPESWLSGA